MNQIKAVGSGRTEGFRVALSTAFYRVLLCSLLLWNATGRATPPPGGTAPVLTPNGGFAIDGDLLANSLVAGTGDWVYSTTSPGTGTGVLSVAGVPLQATTTFHILDPYNSSSTDLIFAGGNKWTDNPNLWGWANSKPSSKTDINNALLHIGHDAEDHVWIAISADRFSTSGDSYIDFEFLQNPLTRNTTNNGFTSAGPHGGRTTNDVLLSLAFTGGGKVADFFAWRWQPNGAGGYAYVDVTGSLPPGRVFAALNSNTVSVPYPAFGQMSYAPNAFVEAAVDLTALLGNFDQCLSFGFKTILIKTKASASSTAGIEDFIDPIQYTLKLGPSADAGPDQTRCIQGESTLFPLQGAATHGLQGIASTTWTLLSGDAVIEAPGSLVTTALVSSASATLRLSVVQSNGCTEIDDVVLWVAPLPSCSITGTALVCPRSTTQFRAPAGMNSYSWSITGNGAISGAANSQVVSVLAGNACGESFTLSLNVISNNCSSVCSSEVLVNDTVAPTIVCPADRVLECPADTRTNVTGVATGQDNCGSVTITYADAVTNLCGGTKVIARTWTATDLCGNQTDCVQTITVRDTIKPTIVCPANRVLECPADTSTNNTGVATAQDACGAVVIGYSDSISNSCAGAQVISRTWTAIDECGNSTSCLQTITVRDTTRPTLVRPSNVVLDCPADTTTNNTGVASSTDACGSVTISYADSVTNNCGGTKIIARLWTAVDECGNTTNGVQTITVRDISLPTIVCPASVVLECPADTSTNNTGVATAQDGCSQVTIRYSDSVTNSCGGAKVIARTWTATDQCSNSVSCVQLITVRDTTIPTLTCPADQIMECPADTRTNITGVATAQDACGSVSIRFSDQVTTNCSGTRIIARTWTATDTCSNVASCVQTITVRDTLRPQLTIPADVVQECPGDTRTNITGMASATDACSAVTITYADSVQNNCGATKVISRTWTAVDQCGNTTNRVQTITVRDTIKPTIVCPPSRTLDCPANTSTNNTGVATGQDGCSQVTITYYDSVTNGCAGSKTIARLWIATDACGNSSSCIQTITVRDITPPTITCPTNLVLECPANTSTNVTGMATATDSCGSVAVTYSDVVTNNCGGTKIISRLWTATDLCGNSASCLQTITVRDTRPPTISCPANVTLECPAVTTTNVTGVATAQDTCGTVTISYLDSVTNTCGGAKIISRLWTATDECGNSASCVQTITVRDTIKPGMTLPANVVLECPAVNVGTNVTGVATATDACGSVAVTFSDSVASACAATKVISRTWTATDQCGNSTSGVQTITVRDTIRPSLVVPANLTLECPANTATNATGVASAQDACGSVTLTYSDSVNNNCGGAKVISRLWTATDQCGNSTNKTQLITLVDTQPPTITAPPNLLLDCPANTTPSSTGSATGQDACSSVSITYTDSTTNFCGGTKIITRTWRATDACSNTVTAVQTITVRDITPPSLKLPNNIVLQCPGDTRTNVTGSPISTDLCGSVTLTYSDVVSNGCSQTKIVQRFWTATDQCGNATNGWQTISVIDTNKPIIAAPNFSVQCVEDIPAPYTNLTAFRSAGGTATDACSATNLGFALISDSGLVGRCPGTVTRVYRVTDECGNFADGTHRITVDDTIAPTIICPSNAIVELGQPLGSNNFARPTATDNCSTNVILTYNDSPVSSEYNINFYSADPDTGTGPYGPTYMRLGPASLPCPPSAIQTGRALDPLRNAVAFGPSATQLDALTSLGGVPMSLGQVVPFEAVIGMSGAPGPERGTVEFSATWATHTTSNVRFGFNTNYMVYCAFVDAADPGCIDPHANARVESISSTIINRGTVTEQILGTFRVSGLDVGDQVVVEIWMVLDSVQDGNVGGTIPAQLVSAAKFLNPPVEITVGSKTISFGNLNKMEPLPPPQPQPPLGPLPPQPPILPGSTVSVFDRTWTATDDCGNSRSCSHRITVRDTTPPTLILPVDMVLECPAADISTNITGSATAIDLDIGPILISYSDTVTNGCSGTKTISRVWMATDRSGNTTNATQRITIQDSTPPVITRPQDVVLECAAAIPSTNLTGVATAQDACGSVVSLNFTDVSTNTCGAARVIARTWTAVDVCGNVGQSVQLITLRDSTPPTITCAPNRTVNAGVPWNFDTPTAIDNCGDVDIQVVNTVTNPPMAGILAATRVWQAVDSCGNSSLCQQTVSVQVGPAPTITSQPAGRDVGFSNNLAMTVSANSSGPFAYQWQLNGTNIPGATGSTFNKSPMVFSDAGLYSVIVSNGGGMVTSRTAVVNVTPRLFSQFSSRTMRLTWPGPFILQSATNVAGPYTDLPGATSPYNRMMTGPQAFFRLRSEPFKLTSTNVGGAFVIQCPGVPGCNFVIQASTNLSTWVNLYTNVSPVTCIDSNAWQHPRCYYRAVLAH